MSIEQINETLRLRKPTKSEWKLALPWYQNMEVMRLSEGITSYVYELENIYVLYEYLSTIGAFYFIEVLEGERWKPIGDVCLWEENLPIAIGDPNYWGQGIGKAVIRKMMTLAKLKGFTEINVPSVFTYNYASRALFESLGFKKVFESDDEISYQKRLPN